MYVSIYFRYSKIYIFDVYAYSLFDDEERRKQPTITDTQLDALRTKDFANWLRDMVSKLLVFL